MKRIVVGWIFAVAACAAALAPESARAIEYELVTIGDPGNADDTTGFGGVAYAYRIGKFHVTIAQYTAFLNAVAVTDTYGLYNAGMGSIAGVAGISRSGEQGSYVYAVMENSGSSANRPATSVSWFNAARFANWMANGQPVGAQDATTTENGTYPLNGTTSGSAVARNAVNPNTGAAPAYALPLEDEWYKAAYYSPLRNDGSGGYFTYATQSDELPGNAIGDAANQANYISEETGYCVSQSPDFSATQNYLTDVGSFTASASHYGTFDQTGNVWQWNDLDGTPGASRGLRGGAYTSTPPYLRSSYRMGYSPDRYNANGGFRLAAPAS